jgi:hypothetical protein
MIVASSTMTRHALAQYPHHLVLALSRPATAVQAKISSSRLSTPMETHILAIKPPEISASSAV